MIIRSTRPESNFYLLDKTISEDKKLSWAARGLLIFLLGKPDNWRVSVEYLSQQTNESAKKTGKQGIYSLLDELIEAGYVVRSEKQAHDEKTGFLLGYDYTVYDSPCKAEPYNAEPCMAKPDKVKPCKANRTLISIESKQGLNLNKQTNNAREEKNEQAIIDNLTSEPKNFEMYFGWKPNQQEFLAYKKSYGVTQDLTPEILEEFIRKAHANKEKHNETKWCNFLAKFLKSWINNPTFEKKPNPHIYQPERPNQEASQLEHDPAYKPFKPLTEAEKTKTPLEALEKMRQKLRGAA